MAAPTVARGPQSGSYVIRLAFEPGAHRDAVIYIAQAAAAGPPWMAIVVGVLALLGTIAVALGPALTERAKHARPPVVTPPATPPAVEGSVDLVRETIADLRQEREEFQAKAERLGHELAEALKDSAAKDVEIARLTARIETLIERLGRPV
ncbi:hypothetical protein AB0425_17600 [Actinosynnema sp. NPDC051121]